MRFSTRDLLWVTLVVGLALGWWVDRGQLARRIASALEGCQWRDEEIRWRDEEIIRLDRKAEAYQARSQRIVREREREIHNRIFGTEP